MPKPSTPTIKTIKPSWQQQLAQAISSPLELLDYLQLNADDFPQCQQANNHFKLKVPLSYAQKMQPKNPHDPLFLQVMSRAEELQNTPHFIDDPVGDLQSAAVPGLLHKYHGRVLLITTGACAVHCRYCFRRHFPYHEHQSSQKEWSAAIHYIRQNTDIKEVILSGGDPLVLSDQRLADLITQLEDISHIKTLRIHTRLPVVLVDRMSADLIQILSQSSLKICMVIHANHANEIASAEIKALTELHQQGVTLLNQSVLLAGVNDQSHILNALSERLFEANVLPYYLHLLDPVAGGAHFDVAQKQALDIIEVMRKQLPGYLVPRLVREIPGKNSKTPVFEL